MKKYKLIKDIGVVCSKIKNEKVCGDAYFIKKFDNKMLISVIDGEGHGKHAQKSSNKILNILKKDFNQPLVKLMHRFHDELKPNSTGNQRGAVVGLCLLSKESLKYCGVGNTDIKIFNENINPFSKTGLLGVTLPHSEEQEFKYAEKGVIIMFSDGISARFTYTDIPLDQPAQKIAEFITKNYGRDVDDKTVVVIK